MEKIHQQVYNEKLVWIHYLIIDVFRFLIPSLFTEDEMKDMFLVDHQEFFALREKFIRPYLNTLGPRGGRR